MDYILKKVWLMFFNFSRFLIQNVLEQIMTCSFQEFSPDFFGVSELFVIITVGIVASFAPKKVKIPLDLLFKEPLEGKSAQRLLQCSHALKQPQVSVITLFSHYV